MKTLLVAGIFFLASVAYTTAGELRYVVQSRSQFGTSDSHYLWRSISAFDACRRASADAILNSGVKNIEQFNNNPNVVMFCETGVVPGMKPKIGVLKAGLQVELLDSKECDPMVHIRVITGNLKGETGCVGAEALSSIKPR